MKVLRQAKRKTQEFICHNCGSVLECEYNDARYYPGIMGRGCYLSSYWYVSCPICDSAIKLNCNVLDEIFPWEDNINENNNTEQI